MLRKPIAVAAFSLSIFPLLTGCGSGGSTSSTGSTTGTPTITLSATSLTFPTTAVSNPIAATLAATTISDESQTGVTKY